MGSKAYQRDSQDAREAAYTYVNNPFEKDSRCARLFDKWKQQKALYDSIDEDMEEIYGQFAVRKQLINNIPGSKQPANKDC